jgi:DHA3 family macrolide efflux protein-like MFS transporter
MGSAEKAMGSAMGQFREGIGYIRANPMISWSLLYLGIAASLVGVLGVVGPGFARDSLGLEAKDFVVVILPLGFGIVTGILLINNFGHVLPRRRIIEGALMILGVSLALLAGAGPIARGLQNVETTAGFSSGGLISLLGVVVAIALLAGVAYAMVAIPAQTQLQEDIPEAARGRIFGILNMLVSVASFLPIIIVGPFADVFGTTTVILAIAVMVGGAGLLSFLLRGPLGPHEIGAPSRGPAGTAGLDPVAIAIAKAADDADGVAGDAAAVPPTDVAAQR